MIKINEYSALQKRSKSCKITAADFLEVPHHGNNTQFLIDHLSSDLKIQKKNLKKVNSFTRFFTSLFESFVKNEFEAKLDKYTREFDQLENNDAILDLYYYGGTTTNREIYFEKFHDNRRHQILIEIVAVLNELIKEPSEKGLKQLKELEIALDAIDGEKLGQVFYCVDEFYTAISAIKSSVTDKIKFLQKKRTFLLRNKYRLTGRDIRQSFRNIIRIIFKNMDDQSGDDDNLFVFNFIKQQVIIQKNWFHGQKNNYRATGYYH